MRTMVRIWMKRLRQGRGYTAKSLAQRLGISQRIIFAWEAGSKTPGGKNLLALAAVLGQEVVDRIEDEDRQVAEAARRAAILAENEPLVEETRRRWLERQAAEAQADSPEEVPAA